MPKVAVVGSREITDYLFVAERLDYFLQDIKGGVVIVSGGAKGVDTLAEQYAEEKGYKTEIYLPDYEKYSGKVAPIKRNTTIMENSEYCIAFTKDDSKGTANAISEANRLGLKIRIIKI